MWFVVGMMVQAHSWLQVLVLVHMWFVVGTLVQAHSWLLVVVAGSHAWILYAH